jgi:hypothetical protein
MFLCALTVSFLKYIPMNEITGSKLWTDSIQPSDVAANWLFGATAQQIAYF